MLTWRYHLLSLVAVFLALGLGVLVGISLSDNGAVQTGQSALLDDIQRDVNYLQSQNGELSRDRASNLRYQDDTFPFIVGGRIQGKKVALVASDAAGDEVIRKATSAIHGAGGQVVTTTVLNPRYDPAAAVSKLKKDLKNDPQFASLDEASLAAVAGKQLAREIGKAGGTRAAGSLQGVLVDSMNGPYDTPVDAVVLVTRSDEE